MGRKASSMQVVPINAGGVINLAIESQLSLGMNTQDNRKTLAEGFSQYLENVQLDNHGFLKPRLGYAPVIAPITTYSNVPSDFDKTNIQGVFRYLTEQGETYFFIVDGYLFNQNGTNITQNIFKNVFTYYQTGKTGQSSDTNLEIVNIDNIPAQIGTSSGIPSIRFQRTIKNLEGAMFKGTLYIPTADIKIGILTYDGSTWAQLNPYLPSLAQAKTIGHNALVPDMPDFVSWGDEATKKVEPPAPYNNILQGDATPFGPLNWITTQLQTNVIGGTSTYSNTNIQLNDSLLTPIPIAPFVSNKPLSSGNKGGSTSGFVPPNSQQLLPTPNIAVVDGASNRDILYSTFVEQSDLPLRMDDLYQISTSYQLLLGMTLEINGKQVRGKINGQNPTLDTLDQVVIIHRYDLPFSWYQETGFDNGGDIDLINITSSFSSSDFDNWYSLIIPLKMSDTNFEAISSISENYTFQYTNGPAVNTGDKNHSPSQLPYDGQGKAPYINSLTTWPTPISGNFTLPSNNGATLYAADLIKEVTDAYSLNAQITSCWVNFYLGLGHNFGLYNDGQRDLDNPNPTFKLKFDPTISQEGQIPGTTRGETIITSMKKNIISFNLAPWLNAMMNQCRALGVTSADFLANFKNAYLNIEGISLADFNTDDTGKSEKFYGDSIFNPKITLGRVTLNYDLSDKATAQKYFPNLIYAKSANIPTNTTTSGKIQIVRYDSSTRGRINSIKLFESGTGSAVNFGTDPDFPLTTSFPYATDNIVNGNSFLQYFHNNMVFSEIINFNNLSQYNYSTKSLIDPGWDNFEYSFFYLPIPSDIDAVTLAGLLNVKIDPTNMQKSLSDALGNFIQIPKENILFLPKGATQSNDITSFTDFIFNIPSDKFILGFRASDITKPSSGNSIGNLLYKQLITVDLETAAVQKTELIHYDQIYSCSKIAFNGQTMVAYRGNKNKRLFFSQIQQPDYFGMNNYIDLDLLDSEQVNSIQYFRNGYVIASDRSLIFWSGNSPTKWTFEKINNEVGSWKDGDLIPVENYLAMLSHDGFYFINSVAISDSRMNLVRFDTKIRSLIAKTNFIDDPLVSIRWAWAKQTLYIWFNNVLMDDGLTRKTICFKYYYLADPNDEDPGWSIDTSETFGSGVDANGKILSEIKFAWEYNNKPRFVSLQPDGSLVVYEQKKFSSASTNFDSLTYTQNAPYNMRVITRGFDVTSDVRQKFFRAGLLELVFEPNVELGGNDAVIPKTNVNVNIDLNVYVDDTEVSNNTPSKPQITNGRITGAITKKSQSIFGGSVLAGDLSSKTALGQSSLNNTTYKTFAWTLRNGKGNHIWFDITFLPEDGDLGLTNFALSRVGFEFMIITYSTNNIRYNKS